MKHYVIALYLLSGFCMFALHAESLDAPTLVVQEYNDNFLVKAAANAGSIAPGVMEEQSVRLYLAKHMPDLPAAKATRLSRLILKLSKKHGIPSGLILSVIRVESNFRPWAVSPVGALGLMQLMPDTAEWLAGRYDMKWDGPATLLDEEINLTMGIRYLGYLKEKYNGDLKKMLSAYNRGPAKVDDELNEGRSLTLGYYQKVRQYLPKLALGPGQLRKTNVD